jgi:hypothetical protein
LKENLRVFMFDQGSAAFHHSSIKAKLEYSAGKGLLSFPAAFFCILFWTSKKEQAFYSIQNSINLYDYMVKKFAA